MRFAKKYVERKIEEQKICHKNDSKKIFAKVNRLGIGAQFMTIFFVNFYEPLYTGWSKF